MSHHTEHSGCCDESGCCSHDHHVCCSSKNSCGEHHHHHSNEESHHFADDLLAMADEAWMEVLKEKIKKHIESNNGKQLDELAKLVSESNNQKWKNKLSNSRTTHDFKEKIHQFFNHG